MPHSINVKEITVLKRPVGSDIVYVKTDMLPSMPPYDQPPVIEFEVVSGKGVDYCRKYFPEVQVFVVNTREEMAECCERLKAKK